MRQEITEKELNKMMVVSGVPRIYAKPDATLMACGTAGEQIIDWLSNAEGYSLLRKGACTVEIVSPSAVAGDAFYCMARAAIIHAIPAKVLHVLDMLEGDGIDGEMWELYENARVLFIEGLCPLRQGELSPTRLLSLEWFIAKWIMDGRAVVFLHECAISDSHTLSARFKARCAEHQKLFIVNV